MLPKWQGCGNPTLVLLKPVEDQCEQGSKALVKLRLPARPGARGLGRWNKGKVGAGGHAADQKTLLNHASTAKAPCKVQDQRCPGSQRVLGALLTRLWLEASPRLACRGPHVNCCNQAQVDQKSSSSSVAQVPHSAVGPLRWPETSATKEQFKEDMLQLPTSLRTRHAPF